MNTEKLVRTTFVLDRDTSERLTQVAHRFARSRSDLVRELLAEPVAVMHKLVVGLPAHPTQDDLRQLALDGLDAIDVLSQESKDLFRKVGRQ